MKINKEDEYGLRILLRIARADADQGLSIPQLSEQEGLSKSYVGKLTRALRLGALIQSTRGQKGGYILTREPQDIMIKQVIDALGGQLFGKEYCGNHTGISRLCTNSVDCSVRSLWKMLQHTVDRLFETVSLADLIGDEQESNSALDQRFRLLYNITQNKVQPEVIVK